MGGMEKTYLRYVCESTCGVVYSSRSTMCFDDSTNVVICGAVRDVAAWEPRTSSLARRYDRDLTQAEEVGSGGEVVLVACEAGQVAAAYGCGLVRVWRSSANEESCSTFEGHRTAPTALKWVKGANTLCSGGANGDVVLWDVVAEKGLCRLRGHTAACSEVCFIVGENEEARYVVSCSRDATTKVWDVGARECVQTLSFGGEEARAPRSLDFDAWRGRLALGGADLQLWGLTTTEGDAPPLKALGTVNRGVNNNSASCLELKFVDAARTEEEGAVLLVLTAASSVQIFMLRPQATSVKKMKRRQKRKRETTQGDDAAAEEEPKAQDECELIRSIEAASPRARSMAFRVLSKGELEVFLGTRKNSIECHRLKYLEEEAVVTLKSSVELPGHRSAVRCLGLSSDGEAVATASAGAVKLWRSAQCVRTLRAAVALCVCFVRQDSAVLVGSKDGSLELCDVATGESTELQDEDGKQAHEGAVWALDVQDATAVSGGADKDVKMWDLSGDVVKHLRTLRVGEDVLAVRFVGAAKRPNRHFVAVATLDACVRLLYADSLKFKLSLYGHKLPALALDGARDAEILATVSADKTLKLWGLEFGELRRSILAHDDAVTCVRFLGSSHYCVTAGKDGLIKQWDCDREDPYVQTFKAGHVGEVWALLADQGGARVFSAGADRSLRCWRRTDQIVFASEEAEVDLENALDKEDATRKEQQQQGIIINVARHTPAVERRAERLAESLELAATQEQAGTTSPLMMGLSPSRYAMNRLATISPAELEPALLLLPIGLVATLLRYVLVVLEETSFDASIDVELCARCAVYALRVHHKAVAAHADLRDPLSRLRIALRERLQRDRKLYGSNLAAIRIADLKHANMAS